MLPIFLKTIVLLAGAARLFAHSLENKFLVLSLIMHIKIQIMKVFKNLNRAARSQF